MVVPMATPRRVRAVDAAIDLIADEGLRGLTHRAVDARAGLPPGSTSSCFRTRLALLQAVLDRLVELDEVTLEQISVDPRDLAGAVTMLVDLLEYRLGPARKRTRARLELYLEAERNPDLRPHLEVASKRFVQRACQGLAAAGVPEPERSARILIAQLDGFAYDAVTRPFFGEADRAWLQKAVEVATGSLLL